MDERLTTAARPETFLADVRFTGLVLAELLLATLFRTPALEAGLFLAAEDLAVKDFAAI